MDETTGSVSPAENSAEAGKLQSKTPETQLGQPETVIVQRIDKDGDPDRVFTDIASGVGTAQGESSTGKAIDMVQDEQGNWKAKSGDDPGYFYTPTPEPEYGTPTSSAGQDTDTAWNQWQSKEPQRQAQYEDINANLDRTWDNFQNNRPLNSQENHNQSSVSRPEPDRVKNEDLQAQSNKEVSGADPEALKKLELQKLKMEGAKLASLIYTEEGQQQIEDARAQIAEVVEKTWKKSAKERVPVGFDRSPQAIESVRQRNEVAAKANQESKEARINHLLMGGEMSTQETDAYLTQTLGYEPLPTNNYAENQKRITLVQQFDSRRNQIRQAYLCKNDEAKPLDERYMPAVSEGRLKFSRITRIQAKEAFASGWEAVKNHEKLSGTVEIGIDGENDDPETQKLIDELNSMEPTGANLEEILHEPANLSPFGEQKANFVRFSGSSGDNIYLGTNHEASESELNQVDSFVADINKGGIENAYIEQAGSGAHDNMDIWLEEKGYKPPANKEEEKTTNELDYLARKLRANGVNVINLDLAHNPSALPFAVEKYGVERTARAINWELSLKASGPDPEKQIDKNKIPDIITELINSSGGQTTRDKVSEIIAGRSFRDEDYFTDEEREAYMQSLIKDNKYALAAHSAHTSALLGEILGNTKMDRLDIKIDAKKIKRIIEETKRGKK